MKNIFLFCFLFFIFILSSCSDDDSVSPVPTVESIGYDIFSQGGVLLKGNISNLGNETILEYGFELVAVLNTGYYEAKYPIALPANQGSFSVEVLQELYPNIEYEFTAYIITENNTYKGALLSFLSNGSASPIMTECLPSTTHIGDEVILKGEKFPTELEAVQLKFGGTEAEILSVSENEIMFIVPRPIGDDRKIEITAYDKTVMELGLLYLHQPIISSINENSAFLSETIVLNGDHFNTNLEYTSATFGTFDAEIISTSRNEIELRIPEEVNYSNTTIRLYAQNNYVNYEGFSLALPVFINIPDEVYTGEYFDITVDRTASTQNKFFINDYQMFPEVIDNTTIRFYIGDGTLFQQRENSLKWQINDVVITSNNPINISNPYYKIKAGFNGDFPFFKFDAFTINNDVKIIGDLANTDGKRYLYSYNDVSRTWISEGTLDSESGTPHVFGFSETAFTYSEYSNAIYGLKRGGFDENFVKVDLNTLVVSELSPNTAQPSYGSGFSYGNKVYFTNTFDTNLWANNLDTDTWDIVTTVPYNTNQQRNNYISTVVEGNYAYFANGGLGAAFNDFWRLDLTTNLWEQLPDHPNPKKESTVYKLNGELHFASSHLWKYNIQQQTWTLIEKQGFPSGYLGTIDAFVQSSIPYLIRKSSALNASLSMYIGDRVE